MTKKISFHTLLLLAAHISSFCAINNNKPKPLPAKNIATIVINDALSILSITNTRIAISYPDGCSIWDYSTNKKIFQLIQHNKCSRNQYITLNKDRTKLALSYINSTKFTESHLSIYNTSTGKKIWKTTLSSSTTDSPAFSPTDDDVILIGDFKDGILCFNYTNNTIRKYPFPFEKTGIFNVPSFNPTKEEYITSRGSIYTLSTNELLFDLDSYFTSSKYSPSGKLIVLCDIHGSCAIFETQSQKINYLIKEPSSCCNKIDAIDFDQTSRILAIIPSLGKSIEYWNAETRTLIAISELPEQYKKIAYSPTSCNRITFSPNGKKIVIATGNQCLILQVPFELIYNMEAVYIPDTKNKCISLLSILNQFTSVSIPPDIKRLLIYSFLKISKVG